MTSKFDSKWLILGLSALLAACISPFEPEISKYESVLVVDGAISNIPGSAYVKLSRTSSYTERRSEPVNAARITLIDDIGHSIQFLNTQPGSYSLPDSDYAGIIGRMYKIHIETADGTICESEFEELQKPIELDVVKYEIELEGDDTERGLQIMVDVENTDNNNAYFYWEYTETWKFQVPFSSPNEPNSEFCYRRVNPPVFIISSTTNLVKNQLLNHPLYFIDVTTNRLYIRYSVLVTQHTLSEESYLYYRDLKEINENRGSLFDNTPTSLVGNIVNLSNSDQIILGNFQISGAVTKRIFIENNDLPRELFVPSGFESCSNFIGGWKKNGHVLDSLFEANWVIMDKSYNPVAEDTIFSITNSRSCFDCKANGTNNIPDFWESE